MFSELAATIEAGATLWEHRGAIMSKAAKAANYAKRGSVRVVMAGAGGVGKSTLGHFLEGKDTDRLRSNYVESPKSEERELPLNLAGSLVIAPGQLPRLKVLDPPLAEALSSEKLSLVINVVAYGYHAIGISYKTSELFDPAMQSPSDFLPRFREARMIHELDCLDHLVQRLTNVATTRVLNILTVVAKQDLWWNQRVDVRDYYAGASSAYGKRMQALGAHFGEKHFLHDVCSASLMINSLRDFEATILAPNAAGYDEPIQFRNLQDLSTKIFSLL